MIDVNSAFAKQVGEHTMHDGRAHLRFDVVAEQGQAARSEAFAPVRLRRDEHRYAIHESTAGLEHLFDIPLGCHLGAHRQIGNDHVRARGAQSADDIVGRARGFTNDALEILADAIVGHTAAYDHSRVRYVGKLTGVVRRRDDGLGQILADFFSIDVECGAEFDVAHVVAAEADVHQSGDHERWIGVTIKLDTLHQGRSTVADTDDCDPDFFPLATAAARPGTHGASIVVWLCRALGRAGCGDAGDFSFSAGLLQNEIQPFKNPSGRSVSASSASGN